MQILPFLKKNSVRTAYFLKIQTNYLEICKYWKGLQPALYPFEASILNCLNIGLSLYA